MQVIRKKAWAMPDSAATDETIYRSRRTLLKGLGAGTMLLAGAALPARAASDPTADLYPVQRNLRYRLDRPITDEKHATTYNNFFEFGSHKGIAKEAQALKLRPWEVRIDGMVEKEMTVGFDDLIRRMPLEERVYRHRCVEAWSMAVPWSGFALKALVDFAKPLGSAKYLRMETQADPDTMPGLIQTWYPWPYTEGLTLAEATNELAFIATGLYGKPIPKQSGAPLRLAVPWKYGFKSLKSIVRFHFTDERPVSFWETLIGKEYGFWANVNPKVDHPRWSQATERVLGTNERVPTLLFNGYGEFVADLYKDMKGERLYM
ncbi:MAG: protein-methionine-sulfoxide reductase catalytic subunit MsrP [Rhodospirillaceae bacterium]|nr:protein-methionine-sulfoxide reductase catalytic subunit MsrP [Rhodospirillaceae bacterium]MDD9928840.1 protein-methionine-sulfoxide reductase catalytic subunit MsrP [Rhodospirillaceae bacterium]